MKTTGLALLLLLLLPFGCAKGLSSGPGEDTKAPAGDAGPGVCGDGTCRGGEGCDTCPDDCGVCQDSTFPSCGDQSCDPEENCGSCPNDCGPCGTSSGIGGGGGVPNTSAGAGGNGGFGEGGSEGAVCGDAFCDPPETEQSCPSDCAQATGSCDHDACSEGPALDASCDICTNIVCAIDSYCCDTEWDGTCVGEADFFCGCP